jgi:hypothetical protein
MDKDFAIIVGVLFVVILLTLTFSTEGITGFNVSSTRLIEYPFEGLEGLPQQMPQQQNVAVKKVEGFAGLQSGPVDEQIIGFMYNNDSNLTCKGYGYTTSKGNVCMSDLDIKLLTTRGMNATGVSDQIGA